MAVYKYKPIDLDRAGVRLLRLLKANFMDEIQCDLFDGWIDQSEDGIPYDALSYTWGSTKKVAQITVNGSIMHVTSNLHTALLHLRYEKVDRILWIDAICIDQNNMAERRHQVQHMSRIYKEAERVVIWLGEGTPQSDLIMDSIKQLQETNVKVEGDWRRSAQLWMNPQHGIGDMDTYHNNMMWREGMELMLKRPWFRRIWILQEIANARVATIHCGRKSVSARTFAQIPSIIGLKTDPHSQAVLDIMPGLSRKESWWGQRQDLHFLLVRFRESEATDERDIIYALLGISSDAYLSDILLPDYTKSLQQAIRDTTSFLLSHTEQDQSLYQFLHWTLPEFLQNLDSLRSAVFRSACENGREAMAELLLAPGYGLRSFDKEGRTPLHQAACNGHHAIVRLLLEKGSSVGIDAFIEDNHDQTPLFQAARNGHDLVVELLLEKGAEHDGKDSRGRTPLSYAAEHGQEAIVQILLKQGAKLESKDLKGRTPLLWAAFGGQEATVRSLLQQGAKSDFKDREGRELLMWAISHQRNPMIQLLLK